MTIDLVPLMREDGELEFVVATPDVVTPPALRREPTGGLFDPVEDLHGAFRGIKEMIDRWRS